MEKKDHSEPDLRVDKWLWSVRLFKTRSQAAEYCRKGRVIIDDIPVKPSRLLREGDIITLRRPPAVFTYRVRGLVDRRQPAKLVSRYLEDITPDEEKEKAIHRNVIVFAKRQRGTGRPTKKDRRDIDRLGDL
jgi:ribosome-associated heat shock protein Hsp15